VVVRKLEALVNHTHTHTHMYTYIYGVRW
jgi:hypothetical protein